MRNFYDEIKSRALEILRAGEGIDQLPFEELIRAERCNIDFNARQALATAQREVEQREPDRRSAFSNKEFYKAVNQITRQLWKEGAARRRKLGARFYSVNEPSRELS